MPLLAALAFCTMPLFETPAHIGLSGPFRFLIDTGATRTVIDRRVAKQIGLQPSRTVAALSTTGALDVEEASVEEFRVDNTPPRPLGVLIADLPRFPTHGRVDGILGMDFFAGHSLLLDVRHRCLQIDASPPNGTSLDAHEVVGRVAIQADGLNFILDSGASFPVLTSARAKGLAGRDTFIEMTSAAGSRQVASVTIPRLRLGSIVLREIPAVVARRDDPREDGLLPILLFDSVYVAADRRSVILRYH